MARLDPLLDSFNGGQVAPWIRGRVDFDKYGSCLERSLNMIFKVQGPACSRPGSQYVGVCKATGATLLDFEASTTACTVLEVGSTYMRFWDAVTRKPILSSSPPAAGTWSPFAGSGVAELVTPWSTVFASDGTIQVQKAQSNDVMWMVHPSAFPQKLSRIAQYKFQIAAMGDGTNVPTPFKSFNPSQSLTMTPDAITGTVHVTASAAYFTSSMVGEYFYMEQPSADATKPWVTNTSYTSGDVVRSNGRNYKALNTATSGTSTPVHSFGAKFDGKTGVQWQYTDDGYGVVLFTTFVSSTSMTGTVVASSVNASQLSAASLSVATTRWARQAWNADDGYPQAVTFFRGRLCFARGNTVWCSVVQDYENFTAFSGGLATADLALTIPLATERNDTIRWLYGGDTLIAGTANGPKSIREQTLAQPFGPGNVFVAPITGMGAAAVQPIKAGEGLLYAQRGGLRVREILFNSGLGAYTTNDLTQLASDIAPPFGFLQFAFTKLPDPILWAIGNGQLRGLTYDRVQQVYGWHPHQLGGVGPFSYTAYGQTFNGVCGVVAVAAVSSPDGVNDDLWMLVTRYGGGSGQVFLEVIGPHEIVDSTGTFYAYDAIPDTRNTCCLDCSAKTSVPTNGTTATCAHIPNGTTAQAVLEGAVIPAAVVASAALPVAASSKPTTRYGRVGFGYNADLKPLSLRGATQSGAAQGKNSRVSWANVHVYNSIGFQLGYDESSTLERVEMRDQGDPMDTGVALQTGWFYSTYDHDYKNEPRVFLRQDQPLPLNVLGIVAKLDVQDAPR